MHARFLLGIIVAPWKIAPIILKFGRRFKKKLL
jgi:hypothetical protein